MSKIKLTLPEGISPVDGKHISFLTPCDCGAADAVTINGVDYELLDTCQRKPVGAWTQGSLVTVAIDCTSKKAYIQSSAAGTDIPITSTPDDNVQIWIDPNEEGEGGGVSIPASDTEPETGNYWLDTSAEGGTYYTAGEVDALLSGLNCIQIDLLWENASPSSSFAEQTIALDLSSFSFVIVTIKRAAGLSGLASWLFEVGGTSSIFVFTTETNWQARGRSVSVPPTGVIFGPGKYYQGSFTQATSSDDSIAVPYRIFGIKGVTA